MTNALDYINKTKERAAIYTYLADVPTMTGPRVTAFGTGAYTFFVKVATTFLEEFVKVTNNIG
jgi:predicted AlkP superfamily pyrophosphatase or phosphodiesterase